MKRVKDAVRDYKDIKEDYLYDDSIFNEEDSRIRRVKEVINNKLSQVDKVIILLYIDCLSYRKLAAKLGVAPMTAHKEVKRIKKIILEYYDGSDD